MNVNATPELKYTKEELMDSVRRIIPDKKISEECISIIEKLVDKGNNVGIEIIPYNPSDLELQIGNHAICFAHKDGKNCFLDSTAECTYRMKGFELIGDSSDRTNFRFNSSYEVFVSSPHSHLAMMWRILRRYPCVSYEDENQMIKEIMKPCDENVDIFDHFYDENKELYSDISHKRLVYLVEIRLYFWKKCGIIYNRY